MANPAFPDSDTALLIDGPVGALEAMVEPPEADVSAQPVTAILCHPLPTEGGTMHNKVVTMAARALRELGVTTVRFNFRGVGKSGGAFDDGNGERDDLRAVAAWVRAQRPQHVFWLAGFSFGAAVSLRAAEELQPALLMSIAPPVPRWELDDLAAPTMPWLVIQGENDEVVDASAVHAWLERLNAQAELVKMPDTSHFFHRKLMDLRGAIKNGVKPYLPVRAT
ncbi:MAG: alpha/beta fold hydrolase [Pseudomonadota bacterium]|nr:alpha/beta fold hydrolase [Pseudomonadota bacterium]MDQ3230000.1 alpha/beta fold hydrolase [Pseudomonadota bacterium]